MKQKTYASLKEVMQREGQANLVRASLIEAIEDLIKEHKVSSKPPIPVRYVGTITGINNQLQQQLGGLLYGSHSQN